MADTFTYTNQLLMSIDGEIDGALALVGNAAGSDSIEFKGKCLISALDLMESARGKIIKFLHLHGLPRPANDNDKPTPSATIVNPVVIEGKFSEVIPDELRPNVVNMAVKLLDDKRQNKSCEQDDSFVYQPVAENF